MNITESYKLLGLPTEAAPDDVKAAYRALTKEHHPDMATGNAVRFQAVQTAYKKVVEHMRAANCETCRGAGFTFKINGFNSMKTGCETCGGSGKRWR